MPSDTVLCIKDTDDPHLIENWITLRCMVEVQHHLKNKTY